MVNQAEEASAWRPWYAPAALAIALIVANVGFLVVILAVYGSHATTAQTNHPSATVTDIATAVEEVGFVVVAIVVACWAGRPRPEQFGLRRPYGALVRVVALVAAGYVALLAFESVWSTIVHSHASERYLVKDVGAHSGTAGVLASCLVLCVIAPFCEEFLFRGLVFGSLRNWRGPVLAALITGVLFGAIHAGSAPAVDLVPLGVFGVMLCAIRQYTGSLYPGIALHSLNNVVALVVNAGWGPGAAVAVLAGSFALIALLVLIGQRGLRLRLV